eukprot:jgi/Chrzof1/10666/Cz05g07160.t1
MAHTVPYTVTLDADSARQLASNGAAVLLLGIPQGTLIGVDQQVFAAGPKFAGIKMLPPGVHLISYQAAGTPGQFAPAVSTFKYLNPKEVVVRMWDQGLEGLVELQDEEEVARYEAGVQRFDFDAGLAPYDLSRYSQWCNLSCYITKELIDTLSPVGGEISIMAEAAGDDNDDDPKSAAEVRLAEQLKAGRRHQKDDGQQLSQQQQQQLLQQPEHTQQQSNSMDIAMSDSVAAAQSGSEGTSEHGDVMQIEDNHDQQHNIDTGIATSSSSSSAAAAQQGPQHVKGGWCFYSKLPRLVKVAGATAAQLTSLNLDKTPLLLQLIAERFEGQGQDVLGELQFAFLAFVCGQSLQGFLQWKALVSLLLSCEEGPLASQQDLFVSFLSVLMTQLQLGLGVPPSGGVGESVTFVDELLEDSFLKRSFGDFFEMLRDNISQAPSALVSQASQLEDLLRQRLGWDYRLQPLHDGADEDDDEYGPVVVELPEGLQLLAD